MGIPGANSGEKLAEGHRLINIPSNIDSACYSIISCHCRDDHVIMCSYVTYLSAFLRKMHMLAVRGGIGKGAIVSKLPSI